MTEKLVGFERRLNKAKRILNENQSRVLRTANIKKHLVIKDAALFIFFFTHLLKDFLNGLLLSPGGLSSLFPQRVVSTTEKIGRLYDI